MKEEIEKILEKVSDNLGDLKVPVSILLLIAGILLLYHYIVILVGPICFGVGIYLLIKGLKDDKSSK